MGCEDGSCNTGNNCSTDCRCGCQGNVPSCGSSGCSMTDKIMCVADRAWEELMVEKMKAQYDKVVGEKMDKTAEAAVQAAIAHWKHKTQGYMTKQEHVSKLRESFMG